MAGLLLVTITTLATGQQNQAKPQREETVRLGAQLVQLDVVVTDREGQAVRGLKCEDFLVLEDGEPQELSFFGAESYGSEDLLAAEADYRSPPKPSVLTLPASAAHGRNIALVIDNLHMNPDSVSRLKPQLIRFVEDEMRPEDLIAVVTTAGGLGYLQQFTSDRAVLKTAIQQLSSFSLASADLEQPPISDYLAQLIDRGDTALLEQAVEETIRDRGMESMPMAKDLGTQIVEARVRKILSEASHSVKDSLSTLSSVIQELRTLTGRKIVIFASDGFVGGGQETLARSPEMLTVLDAATRSGVAIYSIDSRGLMSGQPSASEATKVSASSNQFALLADDTEKRREPLLDLAEGTGGIAVTNSNDLRSALKRVAADNSFYYVLAYYSKNEKADRKWRTIGVKVRDREDLSIRTRKGYFATGAAIPLAMRPTAGPGAAPLIDSLLSPIPKKDIPVRLSVNFIDAKDSGLVAIADLEILGRALNFAEAHDNKSAEMRYASDLDVIGIAANGRGEFAVKFAVTVPLRLKKATMDFVKATGISFRQHLKLKPGLYQVRVAVREKLTGLEGTSNEWIEIPDLTTKALHLGSIFLRPAVEAANARPNGVTKDSPQFPNQSDCHFRSSQMMEAFTVVYNPLVGGQHAEPDVVIQTQIFRDSVAVFTAPLKKVEPSSDPRRLAYGVRLSLQDLPPGRYVLKMAAIDRNASTHSEQSASFLIE